MKNLSLLFILCLIAGCVSKPSSKPVSKPVSTVHFVQLSDDPMNPCAPNCPTNTLPPPQDFPSPPYTNGELACRVISLNTVSVTNTSPYHEYAIQSSTNLLTWSTVTAMQVGMGENQFPVTNLSDVNFYRAFSDSNIVVYPTFGATNGDNSASCPNPSVGYWVYRPTTNIFPFQPVGTVHTIIDPTGSTDTRAYLIGRFGDIKCGSLPLTISTPDSYYTLQIFFKTTMMGTNYPIVLRGFVVRPE